MKLFALWTGGPANGVLRTTYPPDRGTISFASCKTASPLARLKLAASCTPSYAEAGAAESWVNDYNARALVECAGYRLVDAVPSTVATGDARITDGAAGRAPDGRAVIAGHWLETHVVDTQAIEVPSPLAPFPKGTLSATNVKQTRDRLVVDGAGVLHLASFTVRESRTVDATLCACLPCGQSSGQAILSHTSYSQTWYAIPPATKVGAPLRFAEDVVNVNVYDPGNHCGCPPPA